MLTWRRQTDTACPSWVLPVRRTVAVVWSSRADSSRSRLRTCCGNTSVCCHPFFFFHPSYLVFSPRPITTGSFFEQFTANAICSRVCHLQDLQVAQHRTQQGREPSILCQLQLVRFSTDSHGHQDWFLGPDRQEKEDVGLRFAIALEELGRSSSYPFILSFLLSFHLVFSLFICHLFSSLALQHAGEAYRRQGHVLRPCTYCHSFPHTSSRLAG